MGFRNPVTSLPASSIEPGTLPAGVILPVAQLGGGNLPPNVAVALAQLGAGQLPAGVQVALGQLLDGNLPAGVRLAAAQVLDGQLPAGVDVQAASIIGQLVAGQIAAGAITADKLTVGRQAIAQRYVWTFQDLSEWKVTSAAGTTYTQLTPSTSTLDLTGGYAVQLNGGNATWLGAVPIPFDPTALYRVTGRLRQLTDATTGGQDVYLGLAGIAADGTTPVNAFGSANNGSQHYVAAAGLTIHAADGWHTLAGYAQGWAAAGVNGANSAKTDPKAPGALHANVRYVVPILYANYDTGNGQVVLDSIAVEVIPTGVVTADRIIAGAIDGQTITGPLIRTAASGARIEMSNASAVAGWDQRSLRFFSSAAAAGATSAAVVLQYDDPASGASGLWIRSEDDPGTDKTHSQVKMGPHYAEVRASTGDGTVGGASPNMVAVTLDGSAGRVDITRPAIQALAYANSWAAFGSIYPNPGAWKDAQGVIHLEGMLKIPTGFAAGQTIATLPASMRPLVPSGGRVITWAPAGNASGMPVAVRLDLMDTGALVYQGAAVAPTAGQYLNLSGIVVTGA